MAAVREVLLPDIGDFEQVDVIEVLVAPGDRVVAEQSLLVLESDKATMEIPSPVAGVVKQLLVGVGDKVREGTPIARIESDAERDRERRTGRLQSLSLRRSWNEQRRNDRPDSPAFCA